MSEPLYFPLFVDLSEKTVVVAGAGKIASRRIQSLLDFAGTIRVIAKDAVPELKELAASHANLVIKERAFALEDLNGADIVLAVTNDKELNVQIGQWCREKHIPVNVSHEKSLCDFYFPGIVRKDNTVIGVTASGKDHAGARRVTEEIRAWMGENE